MQLGLKDWLRMAQKHIRNDARRNRNGSFHSMVIASHWLNCI